MSFVFLCSNFGAPYILLAAFIFFVVLPLIMIAVSLKYGFWAKPECH